MQLVMFDIDGTLTETMKVDEGCFVRSFAEVFGFTDIDGPWGVTYVNPADDPRKK
jgi:beta-phosphoglucomutase-like phosphatase (HAD superfamily)